MNMLKNVHGSEPLITLVGHVLPNELSDNPESIQILTRGVKVVDAPHELAEFLEYIRTPRIESEAVEWIVNQGGSRDDFNGLVESGRLHRIEGSNPLEKLDSFAGLRLMPMCFPTISDMGVVYVGADANNPIMRISTFCGNVMWETKRKEDLPTAVKRLSPRQDGFHNITVSLLLEDIENLLDKRLARLEPVKGKKSGGLLEIAKDILDSL